MKHIMKAIIVTGVSTLASSAAYAACTVASTTTHSSLGYVTVSAPNDCASTSTVNGQIGGLQTQVNTNTGNISTLQGNLGTLQGTVDGHTVQINTLTGQVLQNGQDIGNLQTLTAGHTVQIQTLSGQVLDLQNVTASQGGQITALQGTVDGHTVQITDLQNTVAGHTTQINQNTSDIGTLQTTKADKSYVDSQNAAQDGVIAGHTTTLADHETRITTNTDNIAATNTRLNSFNGTGGTVEAWATGVDGTLSTHTTQITGLQNWQSQLNGQTVGGSVNLTSVTGASTVTNGDGFVYRDGKGGSISIGGDPTITVTNGSGSTTTITNGSVTASDSVTVGSGGNITSISGGNITTTGAVTANTLSDGAGTTISGGAVTTNTVNAGTVNATTVHADSVTASSVSAAYVYADTLATAGYGNVGQTLTNYGNSISNLYSLYNSQQGQINNLNGRMDKAYAGIAMATAFESPQVDPGKRFGLSLNWGEFEGVSAFSSSAKLRFNDNWAATGGAAVSQGGQVAAKVGIQTQW